LKIDPDNMMNSRTVTGLGPELKRPGFGWNVEPIPKGEVLILDSEPKGESPGMPVG